MSWLAKLYETYEAAKHLDLPREQRLMPISHTLQNAHINIVIDSEGNFRRASVLEKTQVVLPATEKSAGRTSGEAPHPLTDKIQYVAKDYPEYGGRRISFFAGYEKQLSNWCDSDFSHPDANAVLKYIRKGRVVHDLVEHGILFVDDNDELMAFWPEDKEGRKQPPPVFRVLPTIPKEKRKEKDKPEIEPGDAMICWSVEAPGKLGSSTWNNEKLQQRWVSYCASLNESIDFCYVQGKERPVAVNHPAKLRHTGDKAKLISANDSSGFTFRGRFTDSTGVQAASVSFEVTQKAHNALRWLIARQGFRNGDQVFITWAVSGKKTPDPLKSSWELFTADLDKQAVAPDNEKTGIDHTIDLGSTFAHNFNRYLAGYRASLEPNEQIVIMGLDAATPGRMGIIYYRELLACEFLDRLDRWHTEFAWPQRYTREIPHPGKKRKKKEEKENVIWPVSCPAPLAIADAAYGDVLKTNDKLKKNILERIVPSIIDGRPFPRDILENSVRRACNRNSIDSWEWERNIGVACALYKGYHMRFPNKSQQKEFDMTLEEEKTSRNYLYGRLLAIAEYIENVALNVAGENRPTSAARLMQRFADHPFSTWRTMELGLQPYMQRLQANRTGFLVNRKKELDKVLSQFDSDDFVSDQPLDGEFLLGYHCQKQYWREHKPEENPIISDSNTGDQQ